MQGELLVVQQHLNAARGEASKQREELLVELHIKEKELQQLRAALDSATAGLGVHVEQLQAAQDQVRPTVRIAGKCAAFNQVSKQQSAGASPPQVGTQRSAALCGVKLTERHYDIMRQPVLADCSAAEPWRPAKWPHRFSGPGKRGRQSQRGRSG